MTEKVKTRFFKSRVKGIGVGGGMLDVEGYISEDMSDGYVPDLYPNYVQPGIITILRYQNGVLLNKTYAPLSSLVEVMEYER